MASRLRWLAAPVALIAFAASAQIDKLDLRLPKVTDGVVASIRQVNSGSETALAPRTGPRQVGTQSALDQAPLVGAVVFMPTGPASPDQWQFGASLARVTRPIDQIWGKRELALFDPDNNLIRIGSVLHN